jgi:hypothetical protein
MIFALFSLGSSSYSSSVLLILAMLLQDEPVQEIFRKHCLECHSAKKVKGGLRIDSMDALLAGGDSGPSIVPGHPERSLLVKAIHGRDADAVTPMPYKKTLLPPADRQVIEQWIQAAKWTGTNAAKVVDFKPELERRRALTPAFQPLRPDPRSSIDDYIHQKLKDVGLAPAPPADLDTLLRRVSFDLTGLPPGELPRDYEKAVDILLASPRFGETWARHWMDLVRYAESRGHEFDYPIPNAWRYRDYLIRGFNDDKPWPRLVREHIAGDFLPGDAVLGTGFWFFGEWLHSPVDIRGDEMDRVSNQIEVFAKGFLGLTVNCARCHDHKFDAISQKDFYALAGYLKSSAYRQVRLTLDEDRRIAAELDALRPPPIRVAVEPLDVLYEFTAPLIQDGVAFRLARPGDANLDYYLPRGAAVYDPAWPKSSVRTAQLTLKHGTLWYLVRGAGTAFAEVDGHRMVEGPLHKATRTGWKDGFAWRRHDLRDYAGSTHHVRIEFTPAGGDFAVFAIAEGDKPPPLPKDVEAKPPPPPDRTSILRKIQDSPTAPAILDGPRSPEQLLSRGNPRTPAGDVPVRFLDALGAEEVDRLQLAEKVVASPLAARVAVNRVWHHLFGRGIVPSVDDFGQMGLPASHPELLDRLAADFLAEGGSYKKLIRRIVLSDVYRRGGGAPSEKDPSNALLSFRPARRLNAEALRDAMLSVSGRLDLTMYGPSVAVRLDGFQDGRGKPENGPLDGAGRRSVYLAVRRNFLDTLLLAFDFPQPFGPMGRRNVSNVPAQALVLRNHPFVHQQAEVWAKREPSIPEMWRAAFHRPPTSVELSAAEDFLKTASKADLCHALFQAKEFMFVR